MNSNDGEKFNTCWWGSAGAPTSTLLKEAAAREYLYTLAGYAQRSFEEAGGHPPVGFLLLDNNGGAVHVVEDLGDFPMKVWHPLMQSCMVEAKAAFFIVVCPAAVAVSTTKVTSAEGLLGAAREGLLLILDDAHTRQAPLQMLFMPILRKEGGVKLGEVEAIPPLDNYN